MERETEVTTSSSGFTNGDRGAGGKFKKPRKPSAATPYARPSTQSRTHQNQHRDGDGDSAAAAGGWWLSKLVSPASRIISGGSKLIPYFFSTPIKQGSEEVNEGVRDEEQEEFPAILIPSSTEGGQLLQQAENSKDGPHINEHAGDILRNSCDGTRISEIEQMMKEKTFSRDELNRLTEILQSRVVDRSDVDEYGVRDHYTTEGAGKSQTISVEEKQALRLTTAIREGSNPHLKKSALDPVGNSPVEIAKAYVRALKSESGQTFEVERTPVPASLFPSKSSIFSPAPKSSICWPGAMPEQRAYLTPQVERNRVGVHNLLRTPYSRPVHSRSSFKLQNVSDRSLNTSSTQWKQSQIPVYGDNQLVRSSTLLDDDFGSVGPIRSVEHKFDGTIIPNRTRVFPAVRSSPYGVERTDASKTSPSMVKQKHEPGTSSSSIKSLPQTSTSIGGKFLPFDTEVPSASVGISTVNRRTVDVAREISEQLNRSIPTPQKKLEELKLATSWRKPSSSQLTTSTLKAPFREHHVEGSDSRRSDFILGKKNFDQDKEVRETSMLKVQPEQRKVDEARGVNTNTSTSNTVPSVAFSKNRDYQVNTHNVPVGVGESSESEKKQPSTRQSDIDCQDVPWFSKRDVGSESLHVQKKPPRRTFGSKPALSSIFTGKPDPSRAAALDNGFGFTFPVSTSSGALFEPPTPSIMPSLSASGVKQKEESPNLTGLCQQASIPSYSFGSKKTGSVFSFPSASSSSNSSFSNLKFTFGSEKTRISFRSVGEDAICS